MSQETLNILLSGVAALTGVAAVCLSIWHNRQRSREREEDRRLVEEQLTLAREQSEMRPLLRVRDVRLLVPRDSEALDGSVEPRWVNRLRNVGKVNPLDLVMTFLQQGRLMDTLAIDKAVVVEIANEGKAAAHLMTGWVYLDADRLEPIKPFGGPDVSRESGEYRVALIGDQRATVIPPGRAVTLRAHVAVLSPGETRIRYDFVSSEGSETRGDWKVSA